jgi:hypothetical protein
METLVGRKVIFNPIFNVSIHYSNGIEDTPCKKDIQVRDASILGIITKEEHEEVFVAGPPEVNGWFPVYLMPKRVISLLGNNPAVSF